MAFPFSLQGRHPDLVFSKLNTQPTDASCLRFDDGLTTATARLEVRWIATPFLQDSCVPYYMPVYPGAQTGHKLLMTCATRTWPLCLDGMGTSGGACFQRVSHCPGIGREGFFLGRIQLLNPD
ncbi:MAG TPA: hypothetical protein DEQ47_06440 [Solibacterales bacterium]|nr:hypothetical protein [Bryobacterales bacterium]